MEWHKGDLTISTDPALMDLETVHGWLSGTYWATSVPYEVVERSVLGSLAFGVYRGRAQVGIARVITDRATFAYLADVFIAESERGRKTGEWLIETIMAHPELQGLRRWLLATRDAHGLYAKFGFVPLKSAERMMERHDPTIYTKR
jgi:GNAT superfamily N-acetyltransferase